jgi:hypothetical protein
MPIEHEGLLWDRDAKGVIVWKDEYSNSWFPWDPDIDDTMPPKQLIQQEAPIAPADRKTPEGKTSLVGVVVFLVIGWFLFQTCGSDGGDGGGGESGSFSGKVVDYDAINPATLRVYAETTNTGTESATATCTVRGEDPGGSYSGFDFVEVGPIKPGQTETWSANLTITDEGAGFVTDVSVKC